VLDVSRSGYYLWINQKPRRDEQIKQQTLLLKYIRKLFYNSYETYGYRRVQKQLVNQEGIICSKQRVYILMKQNALHIKHKRKFIRTTDSNHDLPISLNLIKQSFKEIKRPNQVWLGDITYLWTKENWFYLATIMDLGTRKIIGWSMKPQINTELVLNALYMAILNRKGSPFFHNRLNPQLWQPDKENTHLLDQFLVFHSDRGSQYASKAYQQALKDHWILSSMSRRGNCYDNAPMESFFHTLKQDATDRLFQPSRDEVKSCVFRYIEGFYNYKRLHSSLGYRSPHEYDQMFYNQVIKQNIVELRNEI